MANTLHSLPSNTANNKPVVLKGTPRNDVLHGSLGHTTFYGGLGDDIYYSKNAGDTIVEYANEGNDTVYADTTFTLPTHVENLTLEGNGNTFGFGNNSNNILIGNSGNNRLSGGRGNDKLEGMAGNDLLLGGDGDDSLYGGDGKDSLYAGDGDDRLYGGDGDDWLEGGHGRDGLVGGDGNDTLNGGSGVDFMRGDQGDDIYYVDNWLDEVDEYFDEGTDTVYSSVSYFINSHVENLTLIGNDNINGYGNEESNILTGNSGKNHLLDYLGGDDTLYGMDGNDLLQSGGGDDRLYGGNGDDILEGGGNDDVLDGGHGNDTLDGDYGVDKMTGGDGNDVYHVDNVNDTVTERSGEGTDTIYSSVSYTAAANVENLTLTGSNNIFGIGNHNDNILTGNKGDNRLSGEDGNDTLYGMGGNDTLLGGNGNDHLNGGDGDDYIAGGSGSDTIITGEGNDTVAFTASDIREGSIDRVVEFDPNTDKLDLSGMRSLLTGSNANLSWSKMFVEKDPEVILQKDRPYLIFDTEQHTLAYREAGSSSSTIFAKFDFVWLGPSNIIG